MCESKSCELIGVQSVSGKLESTGWHGYVNQNSNGTHATTISKTRRYIGATSMGAYYFYAIQKTLPKSERKMQHDQRGTELCKFEILSQMFTVYM